MLSGQGRLMVSRGWRDAPHLVQSAAIPPGRLRHLTPARRYRPSGARRGDSLRNAKVLICMSDQAVILLAEDREDDIVLVRRAFAKAYVLNPLQIVRDGEELVAYLKGEGKYANRAEYPLPDLLLLDLKMPRMDGFQVLEWIRQQPGLSNLRVVVLTSSENMRDVNRAYQLGANSFMVK